VKNKTNIIGSRYSCKSGLIVTDDNKKNKINKALIKLSFMKIKRMNKEKIKINDKKIF
jgi:hypothetical protein